MKKTIKSQRVYEISGKYLKEKLGIDKKYRFRDYIYIPERLEESLLILFKANKSPDIEVELTTKEFCKIFNIETMENSKITIYGSSDLLYWSLFGHNKVKVIIENTKEIK